jgi:hypothetical protein
MIEMRTTLLTGLGVIAVAGLAGAATAQTTPPALAPTAAHSGPHARSPDARGPHHPRGHARRADPVTRAEFVDQHVARLTALDTDRDGVVSVAEREAAVQARRVQHADSRFAKLDANGDGAVSRAEFEAARAARSKGQRPERAGRGDGPGRGIGGGRGQAGPVTISDVAAKLGERFDTMDADHDGVVTPEERRAAAQARRAERRQARPAQQPASPPAGSA